MLTRIPSAEPKFEPREIKVIGGVDFRTTEKSVIGNDLKTKHSSIWSLISTVRIQFGHENVTAGDLPEATHFFANDCLSIPACNADTHRRKYWPASSPSSTL